MIPKRPIQWNSKSAKAAFLQILEELGTTNVKDIHYRSDQQLWWINFYSGEDQSFESFSDLYDWLRTEGND